MAYTEAVGQAAADDQVHPPILSSTRSTPFCRATRGLKLGLQDPTSCWAESRPPRARSTPLHMPPHQMDRCTAPCFFSVRAKVGRSHFFSQSKSRFAHTFSLRAKVESLNFFSQSKSSVARDARRFVLSRKPHVELIDESRSPRARKTILSLR